MASDIGIETNLKFQESRHEAKQRARTMDDKQRAASGGGRQSDERRAEAMFVGLEAGQFR